MKKTFRGEQFSATRRASIAQKETIGLPSGFCTKTSDMYRGRGRKNSINCEVAVPGGAASQGTTQR